MLVDVHLGSSDARDGDVALNHHLVGREDADVDSSEADRLGPECVTRPRIHAETDHTPAPPSEITVSNSLRRTVATFYR